MSSESKQNSRTSAFLDGKLELRFHALILVEDLLTIFLDMERQFLFMVCMDTENRVGLARDDGVAQVSALDGADCDIPLLRAFPYHAGDDLVGIGTAEMYVAAAVAAEKTGARNAEVFEVLWRIASYK